jgi:CHASE2 domain-containing sensor protein
MVNKDPFNYSIITYLWVIALACFGGIVKYINRNNDLKVFTLIRDLITAGFTGLLTFWLCDWVNITGPLSAVLIATSGLMGTRLLKELETLYRLRLGIPAEDTAKKDAPSSGNVK